MRASLLWLVLIAQDPAAKAPEPAWPKLPPAKQDDFYAKLALYKRASAEKAPALAADLAAFGKGAVPLLLGALGKSEGEAKGRIEKVLDSLTEAQDASLLLREAGSKAPAVRAYSLRRASRFGKAEHAALFVRHLADEDAENRYYACLGALRGGSLEGLASLQAEVSRRWGDQRREILEALAGVRGPEATKRLLPLVAGKEDDAALGAMRLLAGAGDGGAVYSISFYLDSKNNRFKEEAVNALRGIVDGAPPLENLSVFDLIEQANQWKDRIKTLKRN